MILLYNVYLEYDRPGQTIAYFRGLYEHKEKSLDVFKYSLMSVKDLYPWSKIIINCELDKKFENRKEELYNFINSIFSSDKLILNLEKRCTKQSEWKKLFNYIDDDLILFFCNHDHIFIDSDIVNFNQTVEEFKNEHSHKNASMHISHWPETIKSFSNFRTCRNNYSFIESDVFDSIQIITKKLYESWWFTGDFEELYLPRTDWAVSDKNGNMTYGIPNPPVKSTCVPYREFFRHYDGYSHIPNRSIFDELSHKKRICSLFPPLFIPTGFFENKIKIYIGYDEVFKDSLNINLKKTNYTLLDENGTDLKVFKSDIPFIYKTRTDLIDVNSEYDEFLYKNKRDFTYLNHLNSEIIGDIFQDDIILEKIKNSYNLTE